MPKIETNYLETIIYKLCCKDPLINDIYVGHTTNFTQRKWAHKTCCANENGKNFNRYVYQFIRNNGGWDNWCMIELEVKNCQNKRQAEATENWWIKKLKATLNSNNPHTLYTENPSLYKKLWYEDNKEEILQKAKEHYEENKEQKMEYQKNYAEENKEHIALTQKEYREKNKDKFAEQKKQYRDTHKKEIKIAHDNWVELNKEKLKEKRGQVINCECGNSYTFGNKNRHFRTKTHTDYENQLCGIIVEPQETISEEEKLQKLKQKQKEYRIKNAEKIKEFKKKYNESHKEKIQEQTKKYYESHKNEIIEQNKKYAEENKEKIQETQKLHYEKNKEKILEKQKQVFVCECGTNVKLNNKSSHYKSLKHKFLLENLYH